MDEKEQFLAISDSIIVVSAQKTSSLSLFTAKA